MSATTGRYAGTRFAGTILSRMHITKPHFDTPAQATTPETPRELSPRRILLGHQLHPDTGARIGVAVLPLPLRKGMNEAINVIGAPGTGKSVLMRRFIEYFSIVEGRCVIVIDPTKNQYWSLALKQSRPEFMEALSEFQNTGEYNYLTRPQAIPEVRVYVPVYDEPLLTMEVMKRDWHATDLLSIRTAGMTPSSFFELGDKEPKGRDFQRYLEEILTRPKAAKNIAHINRELEILMGQKSTARSAESLYNIFYPLCRMGIIRDDGTDVKDMLHAPRTHSPGKISVISLGTNPTDRRRDALLSTILQQLFEYVRDDQSLRPVLVMDEAREFCPADKSEHTTTRNMIIRFHMLVRAWGVTRVFGFQYPNQVAEALLGENTPYNIMLEKSIQLRDTVLEGTGQGRVHIEGVGDPLVPKMKFLVQCLPCVSEHVD